MRRRARKGSGVSQSWLVSYSDVITLLLTFFVLLLSMASFDSTVFSRISRVKNRPELGKTVSFGRVPRRLDEVIDIIVKDPSSVIEKKRKIRDLLFPKDTLPKEIFTGNFEEEIDFLEHPEGLVIVLTDALLFEKNSTFLGKGGKVLLDELAPVIHKVQTDVNISAYAASDDRASEAYELSFFRAAVVLEHFLQKDLPPDRFSVSGYGVDKPLHPGNSPDENRKNRRVEILLKTKPRVGSYI